MGSLSMLVYGPSQSMPEQGGPRKTLTLRLDGVADLSLQRPISPQSHRLSAAVVTAAQPAGRSRHWTRAAVNAIATDDSSKLRST
jgi:hypothetical protein